MTTEPIVSLSTNKRPALHRLSSFLPLAALILLILWPSLRLGPLNGLDGPNHFYRLVALDWHFRHGDFYPRWFSDLHYGFGAPVLNFYAPLAYYIPLALRLIGLPFPAAFHLGLVLGVAAGSLGAYAWGREQFNSPLAGVTVAVTLQMSPSVYSNLLSRAGYPETWALAIVTWLFWATLRWVRRPFPGVRAVFTLLAAALFLTHNVSALMFMPLLAGYCFGLSLDRPRNGLRMMLWFGLSAAHAAALAAFFLLPFLFEAQHIQLERATEPKVFQFQNNFMEWRTIFAPPTHFDPYHVINVQPNSLPWPALAMALASVALTAANWKRHPESRIVAMMAAILVAAILLTNEIALPVWQSAPLLRLIQFPGRLLGVATFLLAWLAAAGLPSGRWRWPAALTFWLATFFFSLPFTYHEPYPLLPQDPQPVDIIRHEIAGGSTALGTTFTQEFLPRTVAEMPPADAMLPRYAENSLPSRLATVPPGLTILEEQNGIKSTRLAYIATQPGALTFNIFHFPGWTAAVDGQPVSIQVSSPHGLITVTAPQGQHDFQLALQPTQPQFIGTLISAAALLALFTIEFKDLRFWPRRPAAIASVESLKLPPGLAWMFLGLLVLRVGVLDRVETPFKFTELDSIAHPLAINFSDQLLLLGYDYPRGGALVSGEAFALRLYWRAVQPLTANYQTTVQLVDQFGNRFGQSDNQNPASLPTSNWSPDRYAIDMHRLQSLAGAPPGEYHVRVGVYALTDGGVRSLDVLADGAPAGVEYDLGTVTVIRAGPQAPGPLRIVESSLAVQTVGVGDRLPFTIAFVTGETVAPEMSAELGLADANGQLIFLTQFAPAGPDYPSAQWTPNELIRYPHAVTLPPDLPAGLARVLLTFRRSDGSPAAAPFALGVITIVEPERSFVIPPMAHRVDHDFGDAIRLLGYDLASETITLYWQSIQPVTTRYTAFIHRFDESGAFIGGNDAPPPRPTTSWLPGEVIIDTRQFSVGERFEIGLYDSDNAERLGDVFVGAPEP